MAKKWTAEEDDFVKSNYPKFSFREIAIRINRSPSAVDKRVWELGLERKYHWTEEEEQILRKYYSQYGGVRLLSNMLGRSIVGVYAKGKSLGLKIQKTKWTSEKIEILKNRYPKEGPSKSLQTDLDSSASSIYNQATLHKLDVSYNFHKKGKLNLLYKGCGDLRPSYYNQIRNRANEANLSFNVSIEFLFDLFEKQDRKCALSGLDLFMDSSESLRGDQTASLDRIDSSKGYEKDNVQWVHKWLNVMKLDHSEEEFFYFCRTVTEYQNQKIKSCFFPDISYYI
jgi:hypothetical protein